MNTAERIWHWIQDNMEVQGRSGYNLEDWIWMWERILFKVDPGKMGIFLRKIENDIFYIFDKNQDDYIQKQEYLCLFVSLRISVKAADFSFKTLDLDRDMKISHKELISAINEFFLSDLTNSPGNFLFGNPEIEKFARRW